MLASRYGIAIGNNLTLLGHPFSVSGLSDGTAFFMTSYLFVTEAALEPLLAAQGQPSYILVTRAAGTSQDVLVQRLRSISGTAVVQKAAMAGNDRNLLAGVFRLPLELMAVIAYVVGALVVGLVVYAATMERSREYGALKALGAANRSLFVTVLAQAIVAAVSGATFGVILALVAGRVVMLAAPQLLVAVTPGAVLLGVIAGLTMAAAGSLLPAAAIGRLAPAEVLR